MSHFRPIWGEGYHQLFRNRFRREKVLPPLYLAWVKEAWHGRRETPFIRFLGLQLRSYIYYLVCRFSEGAKTDVWQNNNNNNNNNNNSSRVLASFPPMNSPMALQHVFTTKNKIRKKNGRNFPTILG